MKKYTDKDKIAATATLKKAAELYKEFFCNKKMLVIYNNLSNPLFLEITATSNNFLHLTGIKVNKEHLLKDITDKNANYKEIFYEKCLNNRLSLEDFDFDTRGETEQKLDVILSTLNPAHSSKMIGDYNGQRLYFKSDTLMGDTKSFLGLFREDGGYYVPNSVMNGDIRDDVTHSRGKSITSKIYLILSKEISDPSYNKIISVSKDKKMKLIFQNC